MGHIKMYPLLTDLMFVMHPLKQFIKFGIHHMPKARQIKMVCHVRPLHQFF